MTFSELRAIALISLFATALAVIHAHAGLAAPQDITGGEVSPKWVKALPSAACKSASLGTYCHLSSPAIADIDGDQRDDIVVATNSGHILAFSGTGSVLWDRDVASLFGLAGGQQTIASSPAIGDLDGDGKLEVVVGTGYVADACRPGGVVVLDRDGRPKGNWPVKAYDNNTPPANCPDPIYGTPALGDLDNDGDLEIVVGGFDHRVYAWHHTGQRLSGFPGKSYLYDLMGWSNMRDQLADTIWSSPALADLNADGYLDIVIGSDEGLLDGTFGNDAWKCPYSLPSGVTKGYCGGALYAYDRTGRFLPGYPKHILEVIQSSPAIVDANRDGRLDVFVGTGTHYYLISPDKPMYGARLFGWSGTGAELPGWEGGRPAQAVLPASPVIGDIAGDDAPEVIIPGLDHRLYAWHLDGKVVSGFPMTPKNYVGSTSAYDVGKSAVLGDYDGDGKMEIFLSAGWNVVIVDGNGQTLTNVNASTDKTTPFFVTEGVLQNNPALGDVDGDGALELIAQNSELTVWDLPGHAKSADWPVFRGNAARTGAPIVRELSVDPPQIDLAGVSGQSQTLSVSLTVRVPQSQFNWSARVISGSGVTLPSKSGAGFDRVTVPLEITWPATLGPGDHMLGQVEITGTGSGYELNSPASVVPVRVRLIRAQARSFIPAVVDRP